MPARVVLRLFTDGAARGNPGPAGMGVVIEAEDGTRLWGGCAYLGEITNNQAEYKALIAGIRKAADWKPDRLEVHMDSQLVVEQMSGRYKIKNTDLQALAMEAKKLLAAFPEVTFNYVPRAKNAAADALANRGIDEHKKKASGVS
jgi:probable phosphoglycerate mutase